MSLETDWAGDTTDRKSTSGYIFMLSGGQLEKELECSSDGPTLIYEDNQSAIAMAKNFQFHRWQSI